jgi:hypothetical protein
MEVSTTGVNLTGSPTVNAVAIANTTQVAAKQDTLVSGTNIKTINGTSVLGSGNITTPNVSGVAGAIQFSDGSAFASDVAQLFWDNTNKRFVVGTNTGVAKVHIKGAGNGIGTNALFVENSTGAPSLILRDNLQANFLGNIFAESNLNVGTSTSLGARVGIKGSGSTSASTSLLVQNSAGTTPFKIPDDGIPQIGSTGLNGKIQFNRTSDGGAIASVGAFNNVLVFTENSGSGFRFDDGYGTFPLFMANSRVSINRGSISDASAQLQVDSTNRGFLPPRMTTTQKNAIASPAAGLIVYDSTTNKLCCYNGSTWNDLF